MCMLFFVPVPNVCGNHNLTALVCRFIEVAPFGQATVLYGGASHDIVLFIAGNDGLRYLYAYDWAEAAFAVGILESYLEQAFFIIQYFTGKTLE